MVGSSDPNSSNALSSKSQPCFASRKIRLTEPEVLRATYAFSIRIHLQGTYVCRYCKKREKKTNQISSVTDRSQTVTLESVIKISFSYLAQLFSNNIDHKKLIPKLKVPAKINLSDPAYKFHDCDITLSADGENCVTCPSCLEKNYNPSLKQDTLTLSDMPSVLSTLVFSPESSPEATSVRPSTIEGSPPNTIDFAPLTISHLNLSNAEETTRLLSMNVKEVWDINIPHSLTERVIEVLHADIQGKDMQRKDLRNKDRLKDRIYALIENQQDAVYKNVYESALWYHDSSNRLVKCLIYNNIEMATYFIRSNFQFGSIKSLLQYYSKNRLVLRGEEARGLKGVLLKRLVCCYVEPRIHQPSSTDTGIIESNTG